MTQAEFLLRPPMLTDSPRRQCRGGAHHMGANDLGIPMAAMAAARNSLKFGPSVASHRTNPNAMMFDPEATAINCLPSNI